MTQSLAITTPADEAFARAEAWITQAELQFNAQKMHTRAAALAAGNSTTITALAERDASFSKEEAEKYLYEAFQAINAPELIAEPVYAAKRAQLILRAAQAAAGLNLTQYVQTAVTTILGNGDNLDAASFIASQHIMHIMKAAEETTKIIEQLKKCHLAGEKSHLLIHQDTSCYGPKNAYYNGGCAQLLPVPESAIAAQERVIRISKPKLCKSKQQSFWTNLFSPESLDVESNDIGLISEGFLQQWQLLLLFNLTDMGYRISFTLHYSQLMVYVHVPGAA
jgi:hypothetical protein